MNKRAVFHLVSYMTLVIGIAIVGCAGVSWFYDEPMRIRLSLLESGLIAIGCGSGCGRATPGCVARLRHALRPRPTGSIRATLR